MSSTPAPAASDVRYEERLSPSIGVWIVAVMLAALSVLVFAPISLATGLVAAGVFLVIEIILLRSTTPRIVVTDSEFQAGRARIEREFLGRVTGYRGEAAQDQQRAKLHGHAYVVMRGWISPVVRVQITDERDRTPYWLISTRRPEELVAALGGSMHEPELDEDPDVDDDALAPQRTDTDGAHG
ncbi:MAG: DUF3093 domain-containing protein [Micrococcus sp.]|nr:DUF3093 domain-containing protein [Micrococcus sp.]